MSLPESAAANFLLTLRYPPDKILDTFRGSFTATAAPGAFTPFRTEVSIPHTYGKAVLVKMSYSLDDGATWQDECTAVPDLSTPSTPVFDTTYVAAYCTSSNVVVTASNFKTSNVAISYKVITMSLS